MSADSQGSADTSRSQHTDVTSEVSSVHDKIGIVIHLDNLECTLNVLLSRWQSGQPK